MVARPVGLQNDPQIRLAAYLHLDLTLVRRMAGRGKIPGRRKNGDWRFHEAAEHQRNHCSKYAGGKVPATKKLGFTRDKPDIKLVK